MLYHFFEYLSQNLDIIGIGVFKYLSFRAGMAALFSLIISIAFGQKIINVLKSFEFFSASSSLLILSQKNTVCVLL